MSEVKTAVRFPAALHQRLKAIADLTRISQNEIVIMSLQAIFDMVDDDSKLVVPEIVVQARALKAYRDRPVRLLSTEEIAPQESLRVAERPPEYGKSKRA